MIGEKAPDFTLKDQFGNDFHLYEKIGKPVLLLFYPKDDSLICTKQLCDYDINLNRFIEKGINVAAISFDSVESHLKFSKKHKLNYPLLSDSEKNVGKLYFAISVFGSMKRKTVLIDEVGFVRMEDERLPLFYLKPEDLINKLHIIN